MAFTVATFIAFTVLVAVLSWWKTRDDDLSTKEGYFLAGRGLPGIVIAGSLMMTNLSAEQLVGRNGQGYAAGMTAMGWETMCPIALTLMALFFIQKYFKLGISTIPEFLESRFDRATRVIVSFIFLVAYIVTMLPLVLYAGSVAMERIFGITALMGGNRFMATTVMCVALGIIGGIYAIFGGLKAIALSDSINGLGLIVGGLLVPVFGFMFLSGQLGGDGSFMDGFDKFLHTNPSYLNAINEVNTPEPWLPWPLLFTGLLVNNMYYWATNQSIIQRTLAAKNLAQAQRGAVFTAFLKLLDPFFITICGLLAYRFFGDGLANSDLAYPSLITTVVPNWLLGIIAAVLFGAILSSFNSALNSCVTLYTLDFHRPLFNQTASDSHLVRVGKRVGTGLAIVSICVAPFVSNAPSGLYDFLQECFGFYSMPILAIVLVGFYTKRVPACAPKITLVVHVILYSISKFLPLNVHYLYVLSVLFPVDLALMLLIGKFKPRATDFILEDSKAVDLTPWKYVKPAALTCFILMLCVYALFSPIGLAR